MSSLGKRFPRYNKLLTLYPASYRKQYGEQMLQTLADMLDHEPNKKSQIWLRTAFDFPFSLAWQQLHYTGEVTKQSTPNYVKLTGVVGGMMLLPFFLALAANGLDKIINNHTLLNSWLWHTPVLAVWVLILPAIAAVLGLITLLTFFLQKKTFRGHWVKSLLDFRSTWPAMTIALVGLFILAIVFFHDSVHCVTGNPVREIHNPHQTWQCVQQKATTTR